MFICYLFSIVDALMGVGFISFFCLRCSMVSLSLLRPLVKVAHNGPIGEKLVLFARPLP